MTIDFSKDNSVKNDIPRIVNGNLVFGHWSDRHQAVKGQEKPGDYVRLDRVVSGWILEFMSVSGEPNLPVIRFEGQKLTTWNDVVYTHAVIDVDGVEFLFPLDGVRGDNEVPDSKIDPDLMSKRQELEEKEKSEYAARIQRWDAERLEKKQQMASAIAAAKHYKPTRQERRWLSRFVESDGRNAHQEVEKFLTRMGIYTYGYTEQIALIKEIWGQKPQTQE